jgi:hypothetical protein
VRRAGRWVVALRMGTGDSAVGADGGGALRLALTMVSSISAVRARPVVRKGGVVSLLRLGVVGWIEPYMSGPGHASAPCGPTPARHPSSRHSGHRQVAGCNGRPWLRRARLSAGATSAGPKSQGAGHGARLPTILPGLQANSHYDDSNKQGMRAKE